MQTCYCNDDNTSDKAKVGVWHFLITCLSFCCYLNSLENGLVHDDVYAIVNNKDIRPETPLSDIFVNDFWGRKLHDAKSHKSFRPLCTLTFRLNYFIHGLHPFGYHLVNILLHTAVTNVFCHILFQFIFLDILPSGLVSMMFATHPVHVEAVTGVVGRGDVLSCLLFLLAFLNYARHLQKSEHINSFFSSHLLLSVLYGTACLFVKEHSVTVFGVCAAYDIIKGKNAVMRLLLPKKHPGKCNDIDEFQSNYAFRGGLIIKRTLFLFVWVILLFTIRLHIMGSKLPAFLEEDNPASFSPHFMTRIFTYLYLLVFNSSLLIAPITLSYDWQVGSIPKIENITDLRNLQTLLFLVVVIALLAVILSRVREDSSLEIPLIGLVFMWIPFLPASNFFFRVGFVVAERILYISSMGFCILVGYGFLTVIKYFIHIKSKSLLSMCYITFALLITFFSIKTVSYNQVWFSRETLFRSGVETLPHNAKAHYNYANFLKDENLTAAAVYHYKEAVRLYPVHSSAHNNLGSLLTSDPEAEYHFLQALKYTPGHYRAMLNLGALYWRTDRYADAEQVLLKCLSLSPNYFDAQNLMVDVLQQNKKYAEANALYQQIIAEQRSNMDILMKYGKFLSDIGQFQESIGIYENLLARGSNIYETICSLAKVHERAGNGKMAVTLYERAITIHPNELKAYHSLAVHYINKNDIQAANQVYEKSLRHCKPTSDHLRNHAAVLFQLNQRKESVDVLEKILIKDHSHHSSHTTLISFLVDMNDERAEQAINRGLNLFPNDQEILLLLADWKRENKMYQDAKKVYQQIVNGNPKNFKAVHNLGILYHMENDLENTEKYYTEAYKLNPNEEILLQNMQKLRRLQKKARSTT